MRAKNQGSSPAPATVPHERNEAIPTKETIQQFLSTALLPIIVGGVTTYLAHLLQPFGISENTIAGELTQLGVFAISALVTFLGAHGILKGIYAPATKTAARRSGV